MKFKTILLFTLFSSCLSLSLFAQGREIVALNQYRGPFDKAKLDIHTYNKIITYASDSTKIEKIYTLENRLSSTTRESYNPDLGYIEAVTQNFDSLSNHTSTRFKNVENDMWMEVFFENGEEVSRLQYSGNKMYRFDIIGKEKPVVTTINPFSARPKNGLSHFYNYFTRKLEGVKRTESGSLLIGIHVDEIGTITNIEWLNEGVASYALAKNVIGIIKSYDFQFDPALDIKGNPTATILRLPVKINYR